MYVCETFKSQPVSAGIGNSRSNPGTLFRARPSSSSSVESASLPPVVGIKLRPRSQYRTLVSRDNLMFTLGAMFVVVEGSVRHASVVTAIDTVQT
jgi:hypothetical protein